MGDRFKKKGRSKSEGESPFQGQHLKPHCCVGERLRETGKKKKSKRQRNKGGNSAGDPPLSIPNREVKPGHADGTAQVGE